MLQTEQRKNDQLKKDKRQDKVEVDLNANVPVKTEKDDSDYGVGALDDQLTIIRRQTIAVKAGNV